MHPIFFYVALAAALALLYWFLRWYWRRHITQWCREHGFELVAFRFSWPWEDAQTEMLTSFQIEVRGRDGLPRTGCLVFGPLFAPFLYDPEVTWD